MLKKIIIFASGTGSNAQKIITTFKNHQSINVLGIYTNNPNAGALNIAKKEKIFGLSFNYLFFHSPSLLNLLKEQQPDLIVLAGFLWKIPESWFPLFQDKIINIHPSLLPLYGGKGMYGDHVHRAVLKDKCIETGISIHYVNEEYDKGQMICQHRFPINENETLESLLPKIRNLEHTYYPKTIEKLLTS